MLPRFSLINPHVTPREIALIFTLKRIKAYRCDLGMSCSYCIMKSLCASGCLAVASYLMKLLRPYLGKSWRIFSFSILWIRSLCSLSYLGYEKIRIRQEIYKFLFRDRALPGNKDFCSKVSLLNFELLNKNIPLVLPSFPIKIWGKWFLGFMSSNRRNTQIQKLLLYLYCRYKTLVFLSLTNNYGLFLIIITKIINLPE